MTRAVTDASQPANNQSVQRLQKLSDAYKKGCGPSLHIVLKTGRRPDLAIAQSQSPKQCEAMCTLPNGDIDWGLRPLLLAPQS